MAASDIGPNWTWMCFLKYMAPFWITLLLFFGVEGLITYTPLMDWLDHKNGYSLPHKLEIYKRTDPRHMDIVVLGTSRTQVGFDPQTFGLHAPRSMNTTNMGLPAADFSLNYYLLKHLVATYGKPRLVLLEMNELKIRAVPGRHSCLDLCELLTLDPGLWGEVLQSRYYTWEDKLDIILMLSPLYRYRNDLEPDMLPETLRGFMESLKPENTRGYQQWAPAPSVVNRISPVKLSQKSRDMARQVMLEASLPTVSYVAPVLDYCRQQGIPVVLFAWPTYPQYAMALRDQPNAWILDVELKRLMQQYFVPYVDLQSGALDDGPALYGDNHHLSGAGARLYSGLLADKLFRLPLVKSVFTEHPSGKKPVST